MSEIQVIKTAMVIVESPVLEIAQNFADPQDTREAFVAVDQPVEELTHSTTGEYEDTVLPSEFQMLDIGKQAEEPGSTPW